MSPDACCYLCRSQFGCMNHRCEHHVIARRTEDADEYARHTVRRPTEDQAIANIIRERRGR